MGSIKEFFGAGFRLLFMLAYSLGGIVGVIYWIVNDEALDAVLSLVIPLYGAISVIVDLL